MHWLLYTLQEIADNPVYTLANVTQTGDLLKLYEEKGEEAVRDVCRERIGQYMYNNGEKSEIIKHSCYQKWRRKMNSGLTVNIGNC